MLGPVLQRFLHEIDPHRQGRVPAFLVVAERSLLVEPDPRGGDEVRIEADEPRVAAVAGGAGLAGDVGPSEHLRALRRAALDHVRHDVGHHVGVRCRDGPRGALFGRHRRLRVLRRPSAPRWLPWLSAVERRPVSSGSAGAASMQSGQASGGSAANTVLPDWSVIASMKYGVTRQPPFANTAKPRAMSSGVTCPVPSASVRFGGNASGPNPNAPMCRMAGPMPVPRSRRMDTQVARAHQRLAHRRRTVEALVDVLWPPLLGPVFPAAARQDDRRVVDQRGRREPLLERGRIDERLERRSGLPLRLHCPVVLARVEVEAAHQRDDRAVPRVERHERGAHGGHLRKAVLPVLERLDVDDLPHREHVARRPRSRAERVLR